jgi:hypothetical protein
MPVVFLLPERGVQIHMPENPEMGYPELWSEASGFV